MRDANFKWTVLDEDDPKTFPPDDDYILISFDNYPLPLIGRYDTDADGGGAFYSGDDDDKSLVSIGLIVNAWAPCPLNYGFQKNE